MAKRANVSITVVSRVMSNRGYVSKEKRAAVLQAADELNYRPSPVARSLQKGQSRQILFYRGDLSSAYYLELHRGMMSYAEKMDYLVCISSDLHIDRIDSIMMDGLILPSLAYAQPEYLTYLRRYPMPYVVIGYGERLPRNVYSVTIDTGLAMREQVAYLRQKGHRRIAFVNGNDTRDICPRTEVFRTLMSEVYHDKVDGYILNTFDGLRMKEPGDFYKIGKTAAVQFARKKLDASAVICFNDDIAMSFCYQIAQLGYRIPQDISVTSFDGLVFGEYLNPTLTSMSLSPFEHGKKCAELILDLAQGGKPLHKHNIRFSLIERESVRSLL